MSPRTTIPPSTTIIPHVKYDDKLMVGYRYWTTTGKHPLFPVRLRAELHDLQLCESAGASRNRHHPAPTVQVSFDVTNTGSVEGAEVAQLYVSDPSAKVNRPERELKGFEKVRLAPGETKHVRSRSMPAPSATGTRQTHNWTIDPGKFVILVGDSSENTPLEADLTLN